MKSNRRPRSVAGQSGRLPGFNSAAAHLPNGLVRSLTGAPARSIGSRSPRRPYGHVGSVKCPIEQTAESGLEGDNLRDHETNPAVVIYKAQPETFRLVIEGETRRYTPDAAVLFEDGRCVIEEVKYRKESEDPEVKRLLDLVRPEIERRGFEFRVRTEDDIRREPRMTNVRLLLRWRPHRISAELAAAIRGALSNGTTATLADLAKSIGLERHNIGELYAAALRRHLVFDLDAEIGPTTIARAPLEAAAKLSDVSTSQWWR
jgi:hypothetical protein